MTVPFSNILVPVDFSIGTEIAVKKAIGFIEKQEAVIHLLHVVRPPRYWNFFFPRVRRKNKPAQQYKVWEAEKKLAQWKYTIEESLPGITAKIHILQKSSVRQAIIESARMLNPDLIIIGRQGDRRQFPFLKGISPGHIAAKTRCPVLTAKPGSIHGRIRVIVIPVRDFVPERKLELAILIARKNKAQVHLVSLPGGAGVDKGHPSPAFVKAYHQLQEDLRHPVEFLAVGNHHPARATLAYAESIMADMILVNPETESGFSSLTGHRHISDLLNHDSRIQILDVQPYD